MFKKELKTPLSNLASLSFECGAFLPEILKLLALFYTYLQKDDPFSCNNYGPISMNILSNSSKIIEKIVHKCLFYF